MVDGTLAQTRRYSDALRKYYDNIYTYRSDIVIVLHLNMGVLKHQQLLYVYPENSEVNRVTSPYIHMTTHVNTFFYWYKFSTYNNTFVLFSNFQVEYFSKFFDIFQFCYKLRIRDGCYTWFILHILLFTVVFLLTIW